MLKRRSHEKGQAGPKTFVAALIYLGVYIALRSLILTGISPGRLYGSIFAGVICSIAARWIYRAKFGSMSFGDIVAGLICFTSGLLGGLIFGLPAVGLVFLYCKFMGKEAETSAARRPTAARPPSAPTLQPLGGNPNQPRSPMNPQIPVADLEKLKKMGSGQSR